MEDDSMITESSSSGQEPTTPESESSSSNKGLKRQRQNQKHTSPSSIRQEKYAHLMAVIEAMGKDIRPTYAGNRTSTERMKRNIAHAKILVRECLKGTETDRRTRRCQ